MEEKKKICMADVVYASKNELWEVIQHGTQEELVNLLTELYKANGVDGLVPRKQLFKLANNKKFEYCWNTINNLILNGRKREEELKEKSE